MINIIAGPKKREINPVSVDSYIATCQFLKVSGHFTSIDTYLGTPEHPEAPSVNEYIWTPIISRMVT